MAFLVSPGVEIKEIDLTNVVPAVSTSIGAISGSFSWGPVMEVVTVGSEKDLLEKFGRPDDATFKYFMPAAQFLQYAQDLKVVRVETTGMLNSNNGGVGIRVRNRTDIETLAFDPADDIIIAKYPGLAGNSIGVEFITSPTAFGISTHRGRFGFPPETTSYCEGRNIVGDEMHVVVTDSNGLWTGNPGEVLEIFEGVSQASDARGESGAANYYVDVINRGSKYIWIGAGLDLADAGKSTLSSSLSLGSDGKFYETVNSPIQYNLSGGAVGAEPTLAQIQNGYELFGDAQTLDVNIIIGVDAGVDDVTLGQYLINLVEGRKDAIVCLSPGVFQTVNNIDAGVDIIEEWADQLSSSSYAVLDSTALYVYDKYNDKFRWIVAAGAIAGTCAFTDQVSDPWFSPAGFTRGQLRGVTKIAFNPNQAQRDYLYKSRVNPIVSYPGEGIVLFGDKTALTKPSAFDRINVRRLFITLEKAIATAARFQLFEFNDEFTRAQFRNMVEPFLRDVQGRRGVTDFRVICDESNNTGEVIDTNRFVADIYVKPARSINFITLSFIATRTGVEFSELVGQ